MPPSSISADTSPIRGIGPARDSDVRQGAVQKLKHDASSKGPLPQLLDYEGVSHSVSRHPAL